MASSSGVEFGEIIESTQTNFPRFDDGCQKSLSGKRKFLKVTKTVAHAVCERKEKERRSAKSQESCKGTSNFARKIGVETKERAKEEEKKKRGMSFFSCLFPSLFLFLCERGDPSKRNQREKRRAANPSQRCGDTARLEKGLKFVVSKGRRTNHAYLIFAPL